MQQITGAPRAKSNLLGILGPSGKSKAAGELPNEQGMLLMDAALKTKLGRGRVM